MKFSIAMATYNGGHYIQQQLKSIAEQDFLPYELVICDDGSTDNTIDIVNDFSQDVPFIVRVYKNTVNLGYTQNFAKAISLCEGDWIVLCDQDDKWFNDKLSEVKKFIHQNISVKVVAHDYYISDGNLNKLPKTNIERIKLSGGEVDSMIAGCTTIIHKDFVSAVLPIPDFVKGHDIWIHQLASYIEGAKKVLEKPLMLYRRHSLNTSTSFMASEIKKTKLNHLLYYKVRNPLPNYLSRMKVLTEIKTRLSILGCNTHMKEIENEILITNERIRILSSAVPMRQFLSLIFLLKGKYNRFNGFLSFFNDIFKVKSNKQND